ncbi:expressed unknown protein [Seminavis robusta]|uniref:TLC domain-containing protein n=1 Tax=Seminavis robusta TaxID=568900 RepID=A0A9N8DC69_9STRA|nr:expressed unknown protein [Seminavis robusta]|eukprot:Sro31_g020290.1 n/a (308) ;mRNA; f:84171-85239
MCRPDVISKAKAPPALQKSSSSFMSVEGAFAQKPSLGFCAAYGAVIMAVLYAFEHSLLYFFDEHKDFHPILQNATNRGILARHIGTDAFCCFVCATMGAACFMTVCPELVHAATGKIKGYQAARGGYELRLFTYSPRAYHLALFFFWYQVKNTIDTILWNDGIVFVAHHAMTLTVAYGTLRHCVCQAYAPFFFGISEISTAVLCLLANFDDTHGVPGLADAFPAGKVALGAAFAVAFIVCRVLLWSYCGYFFVNDAMLALKHSSREAEKPWVKVFLGSFSGLSLLQVIWLGQIILVGKEELYDKNFA